MKGRLEDFTGRKFNYLTVISREFKEGSKKTYWLCFCECGKKTTVCANSLKNSLIQSCGCKKAATISRKRSTHGGRHLPCYKSWSAMMRRCYSEKDTGFIRYGGAGITVCKRWHDFTKFYKDMGERPKGCSIDRIDNSKGYFKDNCRWASRTTQARNTTCNKKHSAFGVSKYIWEWCAITGIKQGVIRQRLHRGKSMEEALLSVHRSTAIKSPEEYKWYPLVESAQDIADKL